MIEYYFDQQKVKAELRSYFSDQKEEINAFGQTVNQTFEAYVFASVIRWYIDEGWRVNIINPKEDEFRLKFSTRGAPGNYSYARCTKGKHICQIRHQIRINTSHKLMNKTKRANICCDVAVIKNFDIQHYSTNDAVPNKMLLSFGEAKHMSAFAELLASFIGLVHELQPIRLRSGYKGRLHIKPFLFVSGILYPTAQGIKETIEERHFDIDIFWHEKPLR